MEYQPNPVDVEAFVVYFRQMNPKLGNAMFTGFRQTETRWRATFQDNELAIEFQGRLDTLRTSVENARGGVTHET